MFAPLEVSKFEVIKEDGNEKEEDPLIKQILVGVFGSLGGAGAFFGGLFGCSKFGKKHCGKLQDEEFGKKESECEFGESENKENKSGMLQRKVIK